MPVPAEVPRSALPHQTVSDKALTITKLGDEVSIGGFAFMIIIFEDTSMWMTENCLHNKLFLFKEQQ